jgi:hypothetical protein
VQSLNFSDWPRIISVLLALLTALVLPGCSVVKLAYNNAESLSYWALDSHMDFNEVQSVTVRAELASLLAWHRANELPQYASTLDKLQRMGPAKVTPEAGVRAGQRCQNPFSDPAGAHRRPGGSNGAHFHAGAAGAHGPPI